jgi:hypothetical protein
VTRTTDLGRSATCWPGQERGASKGFPLFVSKKTKKEKRKGRKKHVADYGAARRPRIVFTGAAPCSYSDDGCQSAATVRCDARRCGVCASPRAGVTGGGHAWVGAFLPLRLQPAIASSFITSCKVDTLGYAIAVEWFSTLRFRGVSGRRPMLGENRHSEHGGKEDFRTLIFWKVKDGKRAENNWLHRKSNEGKFTDYPPHGPRVLLRSPVPEKLSILESMYK